VDIITYTLCPKHDCYYVGECHVCHYVSMMGRLGWPVRCEVLAANAAHLPLVP
jgi:hypothetical protein